MRRQLLFLLWIALTAACVPYTEGVQTPKDPTHSPATISQTQAIQTPEDTDDSVEEREAMVMSQIESRGIQDPMVISAMRAVPRHEFVPEQYQHRAYGDHPLPIGYGQTISQPYMVAKMSETLKVSKGDRVLEIGTGSGYQAAVLAEMGVEVFTIEIIPELAIQAEARLIRLGYQNIRTLIADGYYGWQEHAPFDAIIVTAAPDHLPQPLADQLKEGGRLVIPIGPQGTIQSLWLFERQGGDLEATNLGWVQFVPFTRSQERE